MEFSIARVGSYAAALIGSAGRISYNLFDKPSGEPRRLIPMNAGEHRGVVKKKRNVGNLLETVDLPAIRYKSHETTAI
ncbi:hypothetical protein [Caballeronia sp. LZ034LL]|uniref:hypothetical protein n=1 Tax=Caballeronia sp. LZ034LL TaxID=3038567 RepID=UPI0028659EC1|nr:hypothetical protein [Caballeronia sp. LZ034LL]MDR5833697.1 hypothetical protein [Caballeronia sp. LZ034LL]